MIATVKFCGFSLAQVNDDPVKLRTGAAESETVPTGLVVERVTLTPVAARILAAVLRLAEKDLTASP